MPRLRAWPLPVRGTPIIVRCELGRDGTAYPRFPDALEAQLFVEWVNLAPTARLADALIETVPTEAQRASAAAVAARDEEWREAFSNAATCGITHHDNCNCARFHELLGDAR